MCIGILDAGKQNRIENQNLNYFINQSIHFSKQKGSQYGKLILRMLISEIGVKAELIPLSTSSSIIKSMQFSGLIISGGPASTYSEDAPLFDSVILNLGIPILGICYGMQLLASSSSSSTTSSPTFSDSSSSNSTNTTPNITNTTNTTNGKVIKSELREDGIFSIKLTENGLKSKLFFGLNENQEVLLTHGDVVSQIPDSFEITARVNNTDLITAIESVSLCQYGVQFHPEVRLTECGKKLLENFVFSICDVKPSSEPIQYIQRQQQEASKYIRSFDSQKKILVLVSGGVDSTVCAVLLAKV